jgi:hypothetical protein
VRGSGTFDEDAGAVFAVDDSCFPFVINRWTGAITDADSLARELWQEEIVRRGAHWVTLSDCRGLSLPDGPTRKRIAATMRHLDAKPGPQMVATAFVLNSSVLSNAMSAIRWLAPPKKPEAYTTTPQEAWAWLQKTAERLELTLPPASAELVARLARSEAALRRPGDVEPR